MVCKYYKDCKLTDYQLDEMFKGGESSVEDRDETERIVQEKDREFSNTAMVVKMFQGTEPPHFLQVCQGLFTVYKGSGNDFDGVYCRFR